jgi:hypothetical protein
MSKSLFMLRPIVQLMVAGLLLLTPTVGLACGGFFCDAVSLSPIYQAGERILFVRDEGLVTMHVEITYEGDPTKFGWVLPLAELPTDAKGNVVELTETIQISSQDIFTILQNQTDPTFSRVNSFEDSECEDDMMFSSPSNAESGTDMSTSEEPSVVVLQEAKVGPYNAQMIEATDADELFEWLNEEGYYQDPNAQPLLEHYVDQGFVFLGIRLQNDKDTGDMKPLALTMGEMAPCVPLRLTSIAASPDMPILIWALGEGRAMPKNFIHAVINEQALIYPGASNYISIVTEAVESVRGRAWVTEYADATDRFGVEFISAEAQAAESLTTSTTLSGLLAAMGLDGIPQNDDYQDILKDEVMMPEGLIGYPYGNCVYAEWANDNPDWYEASCFDNEGHQTTEDEFYGFLEYWVELDQQTGDIEADLAVIKARIHEEIITPLSNVQEKFDAEDMTLTRFFTTIDPENMTRDPIFSFNPDLPMVDSAHVLEVSNEWDNQCTPYAIATYGDGSRYTFENTSTFGTIGPVPDAPALLFAQVIEETGQPQNFDPSQAEEIDTLMDLAVVGARTIPDHVMLRTPERNGNPDWPNPPAGHPDVPASSSGGGGGGCSAATTHPWAWAVVLLIGLLGLGLRPRRPMIRAQD